MRKNLKLILIWVFFVLCVFSWNPLKAEDISPQETLNLANQLYYKGQLDQAQTKYHLLLEDGWISGHLFYNLGNIAYQQNKIGEAILYYEKALRIIPRNTDLRANLAFVKEKRVNPFEGYPLYIKILDKIFFWASYLTIQEVLILFVIFWVLVWVLFLVLLIRKSLFVKRLAVVALAGGLILATTLFVSYYKNVKTWAVVLQPEVSVHPTFLEQKKTLYKIYEGSMVMVLSIQDFQESKSWVQIQLPGGQKGWVEKERVGIL